jgi:hypothetical protein
MTRALKFASHSLDQPLKGTGLQILEGRLRRLVEKASILRDELEKSPAGFDKYLVEWRRHSLESAERESLGYKR